MKKVHIYISMVILLVLFLLGLSFSLYQNLPINPDVRATLSQLKPGMDCVTAISITRMSFVLDREVECDRHDIDEWWNSPTDTNIVKMVSGRITALGIGYEIKLGFTETDRLYDVVYKPKRGLLWFLYMDRRPHKWVTINF